MTDPLEEPIRTPLRLDSVTIRPAPQATSVIEGLDLEVAAGESVCLAGRSGTGKTSLLRVAAGLLPPAKGRVLWAGRDVAQMTETERRRWHGAHMGYLDQESAMLEELTIGENVLLPRGGGARTTRQAADRLAELFAALDIAPAAGRRPQRVSVGQRQRAALARALLTNPDLVILDEPTASLDERSAILARDVLQGSRQAGAAILVASHDPLISEWADRVVSLDESI